MRTQITEGKSYICFNGQWTGDCNNYQKPSLFYKWRCNDGFFRSDDGRLSSHTTSDYDIDWSNPLNQEEVVSVARMSDKPYATLPKRASDGINWIVKEYYGDGTVGNMSFDNRADAYVYWASDWFDNCDTI